MSMIVALVIGYFVLVCVLLLFLYGVGRNNAEAHSL
jgi:hypothetical protein